MYEKEAHLAIINDAYSRPNLFLKTITDDLMSISLDIRMKETFNTGLV